MFQCWLIGIHSSLFACMKISFCVSYLMVEDAKIDYPGKIHFVPFPVAPWPRPRCIALKAEIIITLGHSTGSTPFFWLNTISLKIILICSVLGCNTCAHHRRRGSEQIQMKLIRFIWSYSDPICLLSDFADISLHGPVAISRAGVQDLKVWVGSLN